MRFFKPLMVRGGDRTKIDSADNSALTKKQAAADAGFSEWQTRTAVNIANIPKNEFNGTIEGDDSLSLSKLALKGINLRRNEPEYRGYRTRVG